MNPPLATLWVATRSPIHFPVLYDTSTQTFIPPLPSRCVAQLQPGVAPNPYNLNQLYAIPVQPLILFPFTGGATVSGADQVNAMGVFPQRLLRTEIESVGKCLNAGDQTLACIRSCQVTSNRFDCTGAMRMKVRGITGIRFRESYKVQLRPNPPNLIVAYELLGPGQQLLNSCVAPHCLALSVTDPTQIPVRYGGAEDFQSLDARAFSFLKEEVLANLKILFTVRDKITGNERGEAFDVPFQ